MPKRIVIDSSVALKWRLRDEEELKQADALLDDFLLERLRLIVPTLFDYEIANVLKVAVVRQRLDKEEADHILESFRDYALRRFDFLSLQQKAFQLANAYQRSVYDSAYLALAQTMDIWFYTGDLKLFRGVSSALPWVKWIGDYDFQAIPEPMILE